MAPVSLDDAKFVKMMKSFCTSSSESNDLTDFLKHMNAIVKDLLSDAVAVDKVVAFLNEICLKQGSNEAVQYFVNTIWLAGTQLDYENDRNDEKKWYALSSFVSKLVETGIVSSTDLHLTLQEDLLISSGLLSSHFSNKLKKKNTALTFKQNKFNLYNEEKQGWSKLLILLNDLNPSDCSAQIGQLLGIIGQLDVDPNRVLDVILNAFEQSPWNHSFIRLLRHLRYSKLYISEIMGFKFQVYHDSIKQDVVSKESGDDKVVEKNTTDTKDSKESIEKDDKTKVVPTFTSIEGNVLVRRNTPSSLFRLTAMLIAYDFLSVESIMPYLQPTFDETILSADEDIEKMKKQILTFSAISFEKDSNANTSGKKIDETTSITEVDVKARLLKDKKEREIKQLTPAWNILDTLHQVYTNGNQIVGLISGLLEMRNWDSALPLLKSLTASGVDVIAVPEVRNALSSLILYIISDVDQGSGYQRFDLGVPVSEEIVSSYKVPKLQSKQVNSNASNISVDALKNDVPLSLNQVKKIPDTEDSIDNFPALISPTLKYLGNHLCHYPALYQKICAVLFKHVQKRMKNKIGGLEQQMELMKDALSLISQVLFPALTCCSGVPCPTDRLSRCLWTVVSEFDYQVRFDLYSNWNGVGLGKDGLKSPDKSLNCCLAEIDALQNCRALLKRVTADNAKVFGKKMAVYIQPCPLIFFELLVTQVMSYPNLIDFAIACLKYSTELSNDVLAYILLKRFQNSDKGKKKIEKNEINVALWYSNLCTFTASFYRQYPSTGLNCFFDYLLQQLNNGVGTDLLLLKELLLFMGGCDSITDVSEDQFNFLAGGNLLRSRLLQSMDDDVKAQNSLRNSLISSKCAFPILCYVAQMRSQIAHVKNEKEDFGEAVDLKLLSHLYDNTQMILIQYTDFLFAGSNKLEVLVNEIPSISDLINDWKFTIADIFQVARPYIRESLKYSVDTCPKWLQSWHPFSKEFTEGIKKLKPENMSHEIFVLFWSCNLYDIHYPEDCYSNTIPNMTKEKAFLNSEILDLAKTKKMYGNTGGDVESSAQKIMKYKKQIKKIDKVLIQLPNESEAQKIHTSIIATLFAEKILKCKDGDGMNDIEVQAILQECIIKRIMLSPLDAVYSIKFFNVLLSSGMYDNIILLAREVLEVLPNMIYSVTETEASYIGYALNTIMSILKSYMDSEDGLPPSIKNEIDNYFVSNEPVAAELDGAKNKDDVVDEAKNVEVVQDNVTHDNENNNSIQEEENGNDDTSKDKEIKTEVKDDTEKNTVIEIAVDCVPYDTLNHLQKYQSWCHDWHDDICDKFLIYLSCTEYLYLRSSLILLGKIAKNLLVWEDKAILVKKKIEYIEANEERDDLKLMARSLKTLLTQLSSNWVDKYGNKRQKKKKIVMRSTTASSLSGQAKEFTPTKQSSDVTNGNKRSFRAEKSDTEVVGKLSKAESDAKAKLLKSKIAPNNFNDRDSRPNKEYKDTRSYDNRGSDGGGENRGQGDNRGIVRGPDSRAPDGRGTNRALDNNNNRGPPDRGLDGRGNNNTRGVDGRGPDRAIDNRDNRDNRANDRVGDNGQGRGSSDRDRREFGNRGGGRDDFRGNNGNDDRQFDQRGRGDKGQGDFRGSGSTQSNNDDRRRPPLPQSKSREFRAPQADDDRRRPNNESNREFRGPPPSGEDRRQISRDPPRDNTNNNANNRDAPRGNANNNRDAPRDNVNNRGSSRNDSSGRNDSRGGRDSRDSRDSNDNRKDSRDSRDRDQNQAPPAKRGRH